MSNKYRVTYVVEKEFHDIASGELSIQTTESITKAIKSAIHKKFVVFVTYTFGEIASFEIRVPLEDSCFRIYTGYLIYEKEDKSNDSKEQ